MLSGGNDHIASDLELGFTAATSAGMLTGLTPVGVASYAASVFKSGVDNIINEEHDCKEQKMKNWVAANFVSKAAFAQWEANFDDRFAQMFTDWGAITTKYVNMEFRSFDSFPADSKGYLLGVLGYLRGMMDYTDKLWLVTANKGTHGDRNKRNLLASLGRVSEITIEANALAGVLYAGAKACLNRKHKVAEDGKIQEIDEHKCSKYDVDRIAFYLIEYEDHLYKWSEKFINYWDILYDWSAELRHYTHVYGDTHDWADVTSEWTWARCHKQSVHCTWYKTFSDGNFMCGYDDNLMPGFNEYTHYGTYTGRDRTFSRKWCFRQQLFRNRDQKCGWEADNYFGDWNSKCDENGSDWPKHDLMLDRQWQWNQDLWKLYMTTYASFQKKWTFQYWRRSEGTYLDGDWSGLKHMKFSYMEDLVFQWGCDLCEITDHMHSDCKSHCKNNPDWSNGAEPTWKLVRDLKYETETPDHEYYKDKHWRSYIGSRRRNLEETEGDEDNEFFDEAEEDDGPIEIPINHAHRMTHRRRERSNAILDSRKQFLSKRRPSDDSLPDLAAKFIEERLQARVEKDLTDSGDEDSTYLTAEPSTDSEDGDSTDSDKVESRGEEDQKTRKGLGRLLSFVD